MVSPSRYLAHHEAEAERITSMLSQFGHSGETPGFYCRHGAHTNILDCVKCPDDNICHKDHPPLKRRYNPDSEKHDRYLGDHMLWILAKNQETRFAEDALWLQHPETRR